MTHLGRERELARRRSVKARTTVAVEVVCLCEDTWRLCDGRVPADDARRLISYVERVGDDFEVLWLPALTVQHFGSLEAAVAAANHVCLERDAADMGIAG